MSSIFTYLDRVIHGDCIQVMQELPEASVDLIVTDPPYMVNYRSRDGRSFPNEDKALWLKPAFAEMIRVLRPDTFCLSFYGWHKADEFLTAWRDVGFRPVGHITFAKHYASKHGFTQARHESAYLLAKGKPRRPRRPVPDVLPWGRYTGNRWHPTQKPVHALLPIINAYSQVGDIILDPFAGSGTTAIAARQLRRSFIGIEIDPTYFRNATQRLAA